MNQPEDERGSDLELRAALHEADWEALLPTLLRRAAGLPDVEPDDTVSTALSRCLDGARRWKSGEVSLKDFLMEAIRSTASAERTRDRRRRALEGQYTRLQGPMTSHSPEDTQVAAERAAALRRRIERCVAGDTEVEAFVRASFEAEGPRRKIADTLGWSPERVTIVRKRLRRMLLDEFVQTPPPAPVSPREPKSGKGRALVRPRKIDSESSKR